jgi:hypothetical protein
LLPKSRNLLEGYEMSPTFFTISNNAEIRSKYYSHFGDGMWNWKKKYVKILKCCAFFAVVTYGIK